MSYEYKETILSVKNISKSYDVPVLRDINFDVKNITRPNMNQGQIMSLIGISGSGKSTLFRILAGLEKPDSGTVEVFKGANKPLEPVTEGDMGVVFQTSYIYPWRRVKRILEMALNSNSAYFHSSTKKETISHLCEQLDIVKLLDKYPAQLSGGQRQRVAIAEQILNGGDFILLDEPFSGLDGKAIDKVTNILVSLSQTDEYKTIVLVSHDLSNSLAISDTAFILSKEEGKDGATINHQVDLAAQGLAWQPDIKENPNFRELLKKVKSLL